MLDPAPNQVASNVAVAIQSGRRLPATRKSFIPFTLRLDQKPIPINTPT